MTTTIRKKSRQNRGNRTQGYGTIGAHRAKGKRGGHGLTSGKFKHKWSYYTMMRAKGFPGPDGDKWRIGHKGFLRPQNIRKIQNINAINIKDVELNADRWVEQGKIKKDGTTYIINLGDLDIQKLIGKGEVTKKLNITVDQASKGAIEKMKAAKCKLTLLKVEEKPAKDAKKPAATKKKK